MSADKSTTAPSSQTFRDNPILEAKEVSVFFDMERGQSKVVDGVDLNLYPDEILGIVGESGSGKSMLAEAMLNSVVDPGVASGEVIFREPDGSRTNVLTLNENELRDVRWNKISLVFQGAMGSWNPTTTIRTHFLETIDAHGEDPEERMEYAHRLLSDVYLDPERVLDSYPHELSGGMKQRALIALSLILEPEILIMDEPTASLDLLMQRSILNMVRELKEEYDLSIIVITHDLPLVTELADRLAVMYAFDIVEKGTADEMIESTAHPYTKALLQSTPNINTPLEDMKPIEGESPDPVNVPSGCSYHTRCPLADEQCEASDPPYMEVSETHETACFYWERVEEEFQLEINAPSDHAAIFDTDRGRKDEDTPLLSLHDIEVHFTEGGTVFDIFREPDVVKAVDGVSLDIYENDVIALVGESGCGKTTIGKTAVGLIEPTGGNISYRGESLDDIRTGKTDTPFSRVRRALQIIHQDPGSSLNPNRTVLATLSEPLKRWESDLDINDRHTRIMAFLSRVGMNPPEDYAHRYPHQLSGGEKQRVALIRALLVSPDLILCDEAVSALDVSLRVEMMDLLLELQEIFNTSYLFISHDLSNARYITEKANGLIGIMYLGELVEIGTPDRILSDPQHPYTQALVWSTPNLTRSVTHEEVPLRTVDIPDPINPPAGCRFHTRCPEAREVCTTENPQEIPWRRGEHGAACFRTVEDHEYWDSQPLE